MPVVNFGSIGPGATMDEIIDYIAKLQKTLDYLLQGGLDSKNAREFGGFRVNNDSLMHQSGIVGMSSAGSAPTSIRFWAGSSNLATAPFRVQQDGTMYSTKGNIGGFVIGATSLTDTAGTFGLSSAVTAGDDIRFWAGHATPSSAPFQVTEAGNVTVQGGTIRTGAANAARLELVGAGFRGVTADGLLSGLVFNPTATDIVDLFLYHRGAKLVEFYDNVDGFIIRPGSGASYWQLGSTGKTTNASGAWAFLSGSSLDLTNATVTGLASDTVPNHNHGIPDGTVLMVSGGGTVTFSAGGSHSHSVS